MLTLNYVLLFIITYLGLFAGTIISYFTKEELKPGKKYFAYARPVLFSIIFFAYLNFISLNLTISTIFSIIAGIVYYMWGIKSNNYYSDLFAYSLFGIILFETNITLIASLIFIFGLFTASIYYKQKDKLLENLSNIMKRNIVFFIVGILIALF